MHLHTHTRLFTVGLLGLTVSLPLHAVVIQDFEVDTSGITVLSSGTDEDNNSATSIIKRTDGTDSSGDPNDDFLPGVSPSSSGGSWFGEVRMGYERVSDGNFVVIQGDRVKWNDGLQSGGFQSGFGHSVDVFFDDLSFYGPGDGFFYQTTLLDDTNSFATSGGGFGVRAVNDNGLVWRVGADGDNKGFSGTSTTHDISSTGWFTMETVWALNLTGGVDRIDRLYNEAGSIVFSATAEDVLADAADAGQVGAASFGNGDEDGTLSLASAVAVDDTTIVPEPTAFAMLLGLAAMAMSLVRRRRN